MVSARHPQDREELIHAIKACWENLDQARIDKLVMGYKKRMERVIAIEGMMD